MRNCRQMVVVSGKGGTGKTTVLASFAALAQDKVMADTDVDAANLHIVLRPRIHTSEQFYGAQVAVRDLDKCRRSGVCEEACRFDAITVDRVSVHACEGCGLCVLVCPERALRLKPALTGDLYLSETDYGPMTHAKLLPGGESSGRLVTRVRQAAEAIAHDRGLGAIIIDGPPGIGCTATAAMADTDLAVVVTEPTPSGIHDLERVVSTADHFGVPCAVIINKADLNEDCSAQIATFAASRGIHLIGRLPYDPVAGEAISATRPLVEFAPESPLADGVRQCWERVADLLGAG